MSGYQLMIASEVFRGRFRSSFEKPEALVPGQVTEFTIDLHAADHRFLEGHKIMVQVQSTWFPLIDRNPQRFVPNIFLAKDDDFVAATQTVWHTSQHASAIELAITQELGRAR